MDVKSVDSIATPYQNLKNIYLTNEFNYNTFKLPICIFIRNYGKKVNSDDTLLPEGNQAKSYDNPEHFSYHHFGHFRIQHYDNHKDHNPVDVEILRSIDEQSNAESELLREEALNSYIHQIEEEFKKENQKQFEKKGVDLRKVEERYMLAQLKEESKKESDNQKNLGMEPGNLGNEENFVYPKIETQVENNEMKDENSLQHEVQVVIGEELQDIAESTEQQPCVENPEILREEALHCYIHQIEEEFKKKNQKQFEAKGIDLQRVEGRYMIAQSKEESKKASENQMNLELEKNEESLIDSKIEVQIENSEMKDENSLQHEVQIVKGENLENEAECTEQQPCVENPEVLREEAIHCYSHQIEEFKKENQKQFEENGVDLKRVEGRYMIVQSKEERKNESENQMQLEFEKNEESLIDPKIKAQVENSEMKDENSLQHEVQIVKGEENMEQQPCVESPEVLREETLHCIETPEVLREEALHYYIHQIEEEFKKENKKQFEVKGVDLQEVEGRYMIAQSKEESKKASENQMNLELEKNEESLVDPKIEEQVENNEIKEVQVVSEEELQNRAENMEPQPCIENPEVLREEALHYYIHQIEKEFRKENQKQFEVKGVDLQEVEGRYMIVQSKEERKNESENQIEKEVEKNEGNLADCKVDFEVNEKVKEKFLQEEIQAMEQEFENRTGNIELEKNKQSLVDCQVKTHSDNNEKKENNFLQEEIQAMQQEFESKTKDIEQQQCIENSEVLREEALHCYIHQIEEEFKKENQKHFETKGVDLRGVERRYMIAQLKEESTKESENQMQLELEKNEENLIDKEIEAQLDNNNQQNDEDVFQKESKAMALEVFDNRATSMEHHQYMQSPVILQKEAVCHSIQNAGAEFNNMNQKQCKTKGMFFRDVIPEIREERETDANNEKLEWKNEELDSDFIVEIKSEDILEEEGRHVIAQLNEENEKEAANEMNQELVNEENSFGAQSEKIEVKEEDFFHKESQAMSIEEFANRAKSMKQHQYIQEPAVIQKEAGCNAIQNTEKKFKIMTQKQKKTKGMLLRDMIPENKKEHETDAKHLILENEEIGTDFIIEAQFQAMEEAEFEQQADSMEQNHYFEEPENNRRSR